MFVKLDGKTDLPYTPPKGKYVKPHTNINKINGIYSVSHSLLYYIHLYYTIFSLLCQVKR